jgi:hypothetical protein
LRHNLLMTHRCFALLLILAACSTPPPLPDDEVVTTLVRNFGTKLQQVSVLAPQETVAQSMREQYAPFVTTELLERWIADPAAAPGRRTSSPWPERIDVSGASPAGAGTFIVAGDIVETSSTGPAGRTPVRVTVIQTPGGWRISEVQVIGGSS